MRLHRSTQNETHEEITRKNKQIGEHESLAKEGEKRVEELEALHKNGLRYPIPNHGIEKSPLDSLEASYGS